MPSTHVSLHYHIVFATKNRRPLIFPDWRDRLHAYLGGVVRAVGGVPLAVGGMADHVHLLVGLSATHRVADVLREVKHNSTRWVRETVGEEQFSWQEGYGAFTVGYSQVETVRAYIARQEEHHARHSFQEEYVSYLREHGVEYDVRYLW